MSDDSDRPVWNRAREFIETYEVQPEPRKTLVAEVMGENGQFRTVEVDIEQQMQRVMFMMMPCPPTVH